MPPKRSRPLEATDTNTTRGPASKAAQFLAEEDDGEGEEEEEDGDDDAEDKRTGKKNEVEAASSNEEKPSKQEHSDSKPMTPKEKSRAVANKPAFEHPEHAWILSKRAIYWFNTWMREVAVRDPDNFDRCITITTLVTG